MRYWFGGGPADYVVSPGAQTQVTGEVIGYQAILIPGIRLWVYDYDTGNRVTDLLDAAGTQTDHLVTAEYGSVPRFRGPDQTRRLLIGPEPAPVEGEDPAPAPARWVITSTDWPELVDQLNNRVITLENNPGGGDGGEENPEPVATSHPMIWSQAGTIEPRTSAHRYVNLEGRSQTITRVRADATIAAGQVTVHVLTVDMDTGTTTIAAAIPLTPEAPAATVAPEATVSDGTGVTVQVETVGGTTAGEDLTVQVMLR